MGNFLVVPELNSVSNTSRVLRHRMLKIVFVLKAEELTGDRRKFHSDGFIICTIHQTFLEASNVEEQNRHKTLKS